MVRKTGICIPCGRNNVKTFTFSNIKLLFINGKYKTHHKTNSTMIKIIHAGFMFLATLIFTSFLHAQVTSDSAANKPAKKYQAKAPKTQAFGGEAFETSDKTTLRRLGMAGFFIN